MAKRALSSVEGAAINATGEPLALLVEETLTKVETLETQTKLRKAFWVRLFDGAARGNPLGRHLAQSEESWLATHDADLASLHGSVRALALFLKAEGRL